MNISTQNHRPTVRKQPNFQTPAVESEAAASDSVTLGATADNIKSLAVVGAIGLVGAAVGAAGGNYTGALAGLAGAVAGASGGASLAVALPGEKIKTGALVGAVTGAIVGASFGGTATAVALGVAGATLPLGALMGLASGWE